jgi:hypothetical protein
VAAVRDAVLGGLKPKTQGGRPLTGAGLAALLRLVVDGLNGGQLWDIPSRWASFSDHLRVSSVRAAVSHFQAEVRGCVRGVAWATGRKDITHNNATKPNQTNQTKPNQTKPNQTTNRWGRASAT